MIKIEQIFPYTIVYDDKGYGIVDGKGNIVVPCEMDDTDPEEFREEGYKIAESIWNDEYAGLEDETDLQEYVEQVVDTIYDEVSSGQAVIGASEFISPKCIRFADIPLLNKTIKQLCNGSNEDGYYRLRHKLF